MATLTQKQVQELMKLREHVINLYGLLDRDADPTTAVIKQADVANSYTSVIKSLEDYLNRHGDVTFN